MNWRAIRAIIRKDLKVVFQSKAVLMPIIIVPLLLLVLIPGGMGIALTRVEMPEDDLKDFDLMFDRMPDSISRQLDDLDSRQDKIAVLVLVYMFAPMFLILPLMTANVIAADSFAGEKERKTLEALIYTPTSDEELYFAKVLAPWLAALGVTLIGFLLYAVLVNVVLWPVKAAIFFPTLMWVVLVLWVAPAAAGLGLGAMVLVSSRVSTFQEAYQMGGSIVIPVLLLLFGQLGGVIYFSVGFTLFVGLILWLITAVLLWYGAKTFRRGRLLAQLH
ncbi:MAG: ABC transporter permease subunit [Anaerolineae bacterium]|nr:ABC transporter permease subunit [Anaerolineae bacterium]